MRFTAEAKIWPENLGVGKPYHKDVDERLEEWMNYLCYQKLNKTIEVQDALGKIVQFKPKIENTISNFLPTIISYQLGHWKMLVKKSEAMNWLDSQINQIPKTQYYFGIGILSKKTNNKMGYK